MGWIPEKCEDAGETAPSLVPVGVEKVDEMSQNEVIASAYVSEGRSNTPTGGGEILAKLTVFVFPKLYNEKSFGGEDIDVSGIWS